MILRMIYTIICFFIMSNAYANKLLKCNVDSDEQRYSKTPSRFLDGYVEIEMNLTPVKSVFDYKLNVVQAKYIYSVKNKKTKKTETLYQEKKQKQFKKTKKIIWGHPLEKCEIRNKGFMAEKIDFFNLELENRYTHCKVINKNIGVAFDLEIRMGGLYDTILDNPGKVTLTTYEMSSAHEIARRTLKFKECKFTN